METTQTETITETLVESAVEQILDELDKCCDEYELTEADAAQVAERLIHTLTAMYPNR